MSRPLAEIVPDTKLDSDVQPDHTDHFVCGFHTDDDNPRPRKIKERWRRGRQLGSGGYATVWLEVCTLGPQKGQVRAVKGIKCGGIGRLPSSECARELEAIGKFSQPRVSLPASKVSLLGFLTFHHTVPPSLCPVVWVVRNG